MVKVKFATGIVLVTGLIIICFTPKVNSQEILETYVNAEQDIELLLPAGWYSKSFVSDKYFVLQLSRENPVRKRYQVTIVLVKSYLNTNTKSRFRRDIKEYIKLITHYSQTPQVKIIREERERKDGIDHVIIEELIQSKNRNARLYRFEQRSVDVRVDLYLFANDVEFEDYRETFEHIIKTSKLI